MYSFRNDYSEGAHPNILQRLVETNLVQQSGYGEDEYSVAAKEMLKQKLGNPAAAVFFISGGTQSNLIVISSLLKVHEAVISAKTGHIFSHETGAIEATGHRVITVDTKEGKLQAADLKDVLAAYSMRPHVVKPRMVYISNSTEIGTIYSKAELTELRDFCLANNLLLYMDGARMGHALTADSNDLTLTDIGQLTDVCYIGGTKNGALIGEAVVFNNPQLGADFDYVLKQKGALLAKGRLLGIQFLELFKDDLYFTLARKANMLAMKIAKAVQEQGYTFLTPATSNQLFPILPKTLISELSKEYQFYEWEAIDAEHSAVRIITSWATEESVVDAFIAAIRQHK
ncbi:low specificity L-threonine aldolase [Chitinophaga sp. Cy-1792]|uniref:threonine aldolase family protein n=1 Tax=Chitinophaga sp. Cy-1792 TaxID=2608339 RepID=UPI00141F5D16|nr:aminotransferase class I/II-fold pyridoxal phosphate-dependent enzyme [Chitinophaga sp. Cy-1792]NIG54465.1 aminotransferase class I/II-fold pyridoxal phosphate-dependent enzyme [Chitinophaga sp. Cy-1792]